MDGSVFLDHGGDAGGKFYVGLRPWGMGDANSVDVCQATREAVLQKKAGLMSEACILEAASSAPASRHTGVHPSLIYISETKRPHEVT